MKVCSTCLRFCSPANRLTSPRGWELENRMYSTNLRQYIQEHCRSMLTQEETLFRSSSKSLNRCSTVKAGQAAAARSSLELGVLTGKRDVGVLKNTSSTNTNSLSASVRVTLISTRSTLQRNPNGRDAFQRR
ncbi:hypothetical protein F444_18116 [Phytophthora nicotianae P1976]|uniref:Uncharacterized protein n=1 Tax=Phytophthora nicotianae P1976 TaxID=1317066 RepID=A0A080ZCG2_PHYNI|nr:hypothetical protein F444_18116 [Phytophthora nicotianae P1976]